MPILKPVFLPKANKDNKREHDLLRALELLITDLKSIFSDMDDETPTSTYGFYHDRGDPSGIDGTVTTDGAVHELDLSSIVPDDAKTITLRVYIVSDTASRYCYFRKNGNSSWYNIGVITCQVANINNYVDIIVSCDANRIIEYWATNAVFTVGYIVKGWWK